MLTFHFLYVPRLVRAIQKDLLKRIVFVICARSLDPANKSRDVGSGKSNCQHALVYYEIHGTYMEAAKREKRFKNWCRQWKLNVIERMNPTWRDLYEEICA